MSGGGTGGGFLADARALTAFHLSPAHGGGGMSAAGVAAMRGPDVHVSPVAVWELTRKAADGRLSDLPRGGPDGTLAGFLRGQGYRVAEFTWEVAEAANRLPPHHRDPMDRMQIAAALAAGWTVVTSDRVFPLYGVPTVW